MSTLLGKNGGASGTVATLVVDSGANAVAGHTVLLAFAFSSTTIGATTVAVDDATRDWQVAWDDSNGAGFAWVTLVDGDPGFPFNDTISVVATGNVSGDWEILGAVIGGAWQLRGVLPAWVIAASTKLHTDSVTAEAGDLVVSVDVAGGTNSSCSAAAPFTLVDWGHSDGGLRSVALSVVEGAPAGEVVSTNTWSNNHSYSMLVAAFEPTAAAPATVPGVPTGVTATAGDGSATVAFTAPTDNGGAAITGYTVTSSPDGITATGVSSPITVSGLTNGTAYTFTVRAINSVGAGGESDPSSAVTPAAAVTATVPGAPTGVIATAGNAQAVVTFTAPADDGGAAITGYTVTSSPGGITATGATSPITVTGLTNGTAYTFTVRATSSVGDSAESGPSNAVTPNASRVKRRKGGVWVDVKGARERVAGAWVDV